MIADHALRVCVAADIAPAATTFIRHPGESREPVSLF